MYCPTIQLYRPPENVQSASPSRPNVMAIHGSASSGGQWRALANQLRGRAEVFSPDLPGYGKAANCACDRLSALERALSQCQAPIHVIAHSFGGAVALRLAHANPERVASLTLYDPITAQPSASGCHRLPAELDSIWRCYADAPASELMSRFYNFWALDRSWVDLLPHQQERLLRDHPGLCRDMAEITAGHWAIPRYRYHGPVTVFRGQLSPPVSANMARQIARAHVGASVIELPDMGHFAPLTQSDGLNPHLIQALMYGLAARGTETFRAA